MNVQAGLILRPIDALRIGATYTSPTWYTLNDYYLRLLQEIMMIIAGMIQNIRITNLQLLKGQMLQVMCLTNQANLVNPDASTETSTYNGYKSATHERIRTNY